MSFAYRPELWQEFFETGGLASAVGEGSIAVATVHQVLAE